MYKIDERDTMFARVNLVKGTKEYEEYYSKYPDKKDIDDSIRTRPYLCSEDSMTYDEINSPMASAAFAFLNDIKHLSEGPINQVKVDIDKKTITKRIKGLALHYGAKLVGVTKLKDEHFYSHRGRQGDSYGSEVQSNHKYGIVFAVEMNRDMIDRGPLLAEVIETSKCYVDVSVLGVVLGYYIRSLGYEARNHMDANYLLLPTVVAKDAGLGDIGRNSILTTKEYGSRVRLGVVTTDLELESDEYIDFGLEDFCRICKKCSHFCPSTSLSNADYKEEDGKLNWKIDQETCYIKWRYLGTDCGMCVSVCPFGQELDTIKSTASFKGDEAKINEALAEYKKKYGNRRFVPGNPPWLR